MDSGNFGQKTLAWIIIEKWPEEGYMGGSHRRLAIRFRSLAAPGERAHFQIRTQNLALSSSSCGGQQKGKVFLEIALAALSCVLNRVYNRRCGQKLLRLSRVCLYLAQIRSLNVFRGVVGRMHLFFFFNNVIRWWKRIKKRTILYIFCSSFPLFLGGRVYFYHY